ncbi:FadR/GntR family transcriptional regulator [Streptomyces radicis]|uniref:FadR/GntR family transcriptional regulator n=1 Tax=Streptomyces radicis TaxID=1750517 RepID=UPI001603D8F7|nr:FCD domain-containing protein [Streptomyces radicis]
MHRIRPAYEQVADQIRELIVEGELVPGDRLPNEGDVASAFGVSRGTVREAIRILTAANLLYSVRGAHGGTFVTRTDPSVLREHLETGLGILSGSDAISLDELLDTRMLLEVPTARLAAERRTEEHLVSLREAVAAEPPGSNVRYQYHRRFHTELLEASGNRLLQLVTVPVFGVIRSRFVIPPSRRKFWNEIESDHEEILALVEAADGEGAADAMRRHLVRLNAFYQSLGTSALPQPRRTRPFPVR